jgi:hypothetical protein
MFRHYDKSKFVLQYTNSVGSNPGEGEEKKKSHLKIKL